MIVQLIYVCVLYVIIVWSKKSSLMYPKENISYDDFVKKAKTGDIFLTYSSKNFFSYIHSLIMFSPITHASLIVKHNDDIYMFESGAPRGVQLRKLKEYLMEGADYAWLMSFDISDKHRSVIQLEMEKISNKAYDWNFLKSSDLTGYDSPYQSEELGFSCADLVVEVLYKSKILKQKKKIFPKQFLDNSLDFLKKPSFPLNILFNK